MSNALQGKTIAFLATDGFEQVELTQPWQAVIEAGATAHLIAPKPGTIHGYNHLDKADSFNVDKPVANARAEDYDALVLPGGVANPDALRTDADAVAFVKAFFTQSKPVAAICHGPWTLVEADVVKGRTLTSWPSLKTDINNAGGRWVDAQVQIDEHLITSRKPSDLDAFCAKLIEEVADSRRAA